MYKHQTIYCGRIQLFLHENHAQITDLLFLLEFIFVTANHTFDWLSGEDLKR